MIYMKAQRAQIIEECTLKESSAINKILGQKWKELPRSEQDKYYELAKEERNRHMQLYPGWSARDNYGLRKKRQGGSHVSSPVNTNNHKKVSRENHSMMTSTSHHNTSFGQQYHNHSNTSFASNSPHHGNNSTTTTVKNHMQLDADCLNQKKCRARFGLEGQGQWCKHCRRKKKCTRFLEDDMTNNMINGSHHGLTMVTPRGGGSGSNGDPSSFGSPGTARSDDDSFTGDDMMHEPDSEIALARQLDSIDYDDEDDENKEYE